MTQLNTTLRQLRLSGLMQTLDVRLQEATAGRLGHSEFLELILQDELNVRHQRMLARRTKAADFRTLKTLEDFDWHFNPSISANRSLNWPQAITCAKARMCSLPAHLESAKRIWLKRWAMKPSN